MRAPPFWSPYEALIPRGFCASGLCLYAPIYEEPFDNVQVIDRDRIRDRSREDEASWARGSLSSSLPTGSYPHHVTHTQTTTLDISQLIKALSLTFKELKDLLPHCDGALFTFPIT